MASRRLSSVFVGVECEHWSRVTMAGNTEKGLHGKAKKKKKPLGKRMRRDGLVVGPSMKKKKKTNTEEEKQVPRTLENTREFDETMVNPDDEEV